MLGPGDQLLSINNQCVSHLTAQNVYQLIDASQDPILITIKKDEEILGNDVFATLRIYSPVSVLFFQSQNF